MSVPVSTFVRRATAALGAAAITMPLVLFPASAGSATSQSADQAGRAALLAPLADPRWIGGPRPVGPDSRRWATSPYDASTSASTMLDVTTADATQSSGVVLVSTTVDFGAGEAAGTGLVLDGEDGLVVTNHHVVEGATRVMISMHGTDESYRATVLGTDAEKDIAVLRLHGAPDVAEVASDDDGVAIGNAMTAVGDAGGDGGNLTAAAGTVTGLGESITVTEDDGSQSTLAGLLELDADVISGDSGGAVLDAQGEVVGMTVAASSGYGDIVGYAIPIQRVERVAAKVVAGEESGSLELGYDAFLGVSLVSGTGAPVVAGVVDGLATDASGLTAGDTITALDGSAVSTIADLQRVIAAHQPGDVVSISWTSAEGERHQARTALSRAPIA